MPAMVAIDGVIKIDATAIELLEIVMTSEFLASGAW
jgi:hypothetical protein